MKIEKPTEEIPDGLITKKDGALTIQPKHLGEATEYCVEIDSEPGKHDVTLHTAVLLYGGEFYSYTYAASYNHGCGEDAGNWGPVKLTKVEPVEVTAVEWRAVT